MTSLSPFIELQRKSNRITLIVGIVMIIFGGALYLIPASTERDVIIRYAIMGFFILMGVFAVVLGVQDPERAAAIVALRDNPGDIVWIYVQRNLKNGQHVGSELRVALSSGKTVGLGLGVGREQELQKLAHDHAPHAHVGFDADLELKFKNDPSSLRRA